MTVEQLRQLEQAATPGPWTTHHRDDVDWLTKSVQARGKDADDHEPGSLAGPVWPKEQHPAFCSGWPHRNARADAELIAAARNVLPALLDIAEELRGVVEAGQLPEAETAIFADMLARLDTEGQR